MKYTEPVTKEAGRHVHIQTDGGSRGNPGPAAYGYVIYSPDGDIMRQEGHYIGVATNNQAEYRGIVAALESAQTLTISDPIVCSLDSELVVRQIKGLYRMKNELLRPYLTRIHELVRLFPSGVQFEHITRDKNTYADRLVNQALDGNEQSPKSK